PWDENVGFDEYCLWEGPEKIESHFGTNPVTSGARKDLNLSDTRYWHPSTVENGKYLEVKEKDFGPDQRCDFLLDFMERMTSKEKPFVAYWPTVIPHGPYSTTPDHGKPMDLELEKPDFKGLSKEGKEKAVAKYEKKRTQRFARLIEYMDKLIGKLITKAEDLGIYENTYFIFCADNGTAVTAKDRGVERGVHVPFVVRGPSIKTLGITNELTDFSDVAPTLLEMAGIPKPEDLYFDGTSQVPFLTGKTKSQREWIYAYTGSVQVLRTKQYLLEARSHLLGKPKGRFYFTGDDRFGRGYERAEELPEHAPTLSLFKRVLDSMPSHLGKDHPFWDSKYGKRWSQNNPKLEELLSKQLYNHPDYSRYDESD
ncbi:MAG: sulfatase-like hydrolase/transferase, partial [Opitutae bacterium]|nr:sulfatase-like hydrolase/transferase [Opitutae bacterium]